MPRRAGRLRPGRPHVAGIRPRTARGFAPAKPCVARPSPLDYVLSMLTPRLRFRLLGPLDIEIDGRAVSLTGRQRALCAVLLLHANHVVSVDRLIQCLWDDRPPGAGAARVRALVAEVRRALGPSGT